MNVVQKRIVKGARQIKANRTGYDQSQKGRWSVFDFAHKLLLKAKAVDCSAAYAGLLRMAGIPINTKGTCYTGNIASLAKATGMVSVERYRSLDQGKPGGAFLTPGKHIVTVLDKGEVLSPEVNERGKTTGGKPGDQTGREVRIRKAYVRPGGWKYVLNIIPPAVHLRRAIVAFGKGQNWKVHVDRMSIVAPHDGPLTGAFLTAWTRLNRGMTLAYTPTTITGMGKIALVVLGTKLNPDGTVTKKYVQRLQLTLDAANANPAAIVVVSGGKAYNGVTEAEAGMTWLIGHGLDKSRVHVEEASNSTVGNALGTVPLLVKLGVQTYVLVSHASHLRRASIDFLAATLKMESATNKASGLTQLATPYAVDDYTPRPVKTSLPVSDSDRATMAAEIIAVLGL